ncbi:MAG: hypothetical protein IK032_05605, partial [Bacteroidales bacterium]|nr:hypothetical protein [Bacteroidales bacterium]
NTTVNANATATTVSNQNNSNANGVKANPTNFRGNKGVNNNAKADCNNQGKPCSHANDCKKPCNNNKGNNKGPKTDATPTMTTTVGK